MTLIGLTGGIASGKSTVARRLAEHGAVVLDADQLAREVVEPGTDALRLIVETFGPEVLEPSGRLNRAALGAIVFADTSARKQLEQIVHPAVHSAFASKLAQALAEDPSAVVVYDVPLLVESDNEYDFDLIVVVHASPEVRIQRLLEHRGFDRAAAEARVSAQADDVTRLAQADVVIESSGTLAETIAQVDALWLDRLAKLR
ncbi:MAG: dephospho-CoA kinase [Agromyces sp.]